MRERLLKQTVRHVYATGMQLIFARAIETAPTNAASAVIALARFDFLFGPPTSSISKFK